MVIPWHEACPEGTADSDGYEDCSDETSLEVIGVAEDVCEALEKTEDDNVF